MGTLRTDRIWLLGGLLAIVVLGAGGWFLLVHPKYTDAGNVRTQVADGQVGLATLNKQLATLKAQKAQLGALTAARSKYQQALPSNGTTSIAAFLSELQNSETAENVAVTGLTQGGPQASTAVPGVWELPITMNATGTAANLSAFLNRLQTGQTRAVLISTASLNGDDGSAPGSVTLSLAMKAFVAPVTGKTPTLTTTN